MIIVGIDGQGGDSDDNRIVESMEIVPNEVPYPTTREYRYTLLVLQR